MEIERLTDGEEEEGISFLKERPLDDAAKKKQIWLWLRKRRRRSISQESNAEVCGTMTEDKNQQRFLNTKGEKRERLLGRSTDQYLTMHCGKEKIEAFYFHSPAS
ncbi:hypothetical protein AT2G21595 [Arabidopsis thaliana]|uniref:Uncharacterized protein n=1 Tax=Arabidopsis thaliana TaxID=3702 RepID=A0A1P8B1T3_ARATH|nr:uncharacterized protein AT2G21595 [Arabidopsis thaliana]ANM62851.1 hypothetical protein AT2G21595 [Arabidopsis thaliana]|eukprot:NP_001324977.1 hypothetical protein AT2G21595 [Arabidopsis thaliana]